MNTNDEKHLRETMRLLERKLGLLKENEFSCCGVSLTQCHALVEIGRAGRVSLNDLAELLNVDASTMSRTVNNLVKKRLVKRSADQNDRRFIRIEVTGSGKSLFEGIEADMGGYYKKIFEAIPEEKRAQVLESLELLMNAIPEDCCK